jgi:hypothetical protein
MHAGAPTNEYLPATQSAAAGVADVLPAGHP